MMLSFAWKVVSLFLPAVVLLIIGHSHITFADDGSPHLSLNSWTSAIVGDQNGIIFDAGGGEKITTVNCERRSIDKKSRRGRLNKNELRSESSCRWHDASSPATPGTTGSNEIPASDEDKPPNEDTTPTTELKLTIEDLKEIFYGSDFSTLCSNPKFPEYVFPVCHPYGASLFDFPIDVYTNDGITPRSFPRELLSPCRQCEF